jgi:hypothetical protein
MLNPFRALCIYFNRKRKERLRKRLVTVSVARLTFHHEPAHKVLLQLDLMNPNSAIDFLTEVLITGEFNDNCGEFALKYWDIANIETPILKQCYFINRVPPCIIDCFKQYRRRYSN